jgi:hypothetical protein
MEQRSHLNIACAFLDEETREAAVHVASAVAAGGVMIGMRWLMVEIRIRETARYMHKHQERSINNRADCIKAASVLTRARPPREHTLRRLPASYAATQRESLLL